MKILILLAGLAALSSSSDLLAAELSASVLNCGGGRSTSAVYAVDTELGGISGANTGSTGSCMSGFIGQLTEVTGLTLTCVPAPLPEGSMAQLGGMASMDDGTATSLAGADMAWSSIDMPYPLCALSGTGLVTATNVYRDASFTIRGSYSGVMTTGTWFVHDVQFDNFGTYAGDGLPDAWQERYFGLDNTNAAPTADADHTGQDNLYKYVADLDPTNPASVFKVVDITNRPTDVLVAFTSSSNRFYTLEAAALLAPTQWVTASAGAPVRGNGAIFSLTGTNTGPLRFHRVRVQVAP